MMAASTTPGHVSFDSAHAAGMACSSRSAKHKQAIQISLTTSSTQAQILHEKEMPPWCRCR